MKLTEHHLKKIVLEEITSLKKRLLEEPRYGITSSESRTTDSLLEAFEDKEFSDILMRTESPIMSWRKSGSNSIELDVEGIAGDMTVYRLTISKL
jgi:hypothetical protein